MIQSKHQFSSQFKLVNSVQIRHIYNNGQKTHLGFITVFKMLNELDHPRICISVPKKFVATAVLRHRIKRLVRESFRLNHNNIENVDIIVAISRRYEKKSELILCEQLKKLWTKLQIYS